MATASPATSPGFTVNSDEPLVPAMHLTSPTSTTPSIRTHFACAVNFVPVGRFTAEYSATTKKRAWGGQWKRATSSPKSVIVVEVAASFSQKEFRTSYKIYLASRKTVVPTVCHCDYFANSLWYKGGGADGSQRKRVWLMYMEYEIEAGFWSAGNGGDGVADASEEDGEVVRGRWYGVSCSFSGGAAEGEVTLWRHQNHFRQECQNSRDLLHVLGLGRDSTISFGGKSAKRATMWGRGYPRRTLFHIDGFPALIRPP
ncbi:hypothetical protein C8R45DRAFT_928967 [Mycena sanguinolenta]|nr:hypothetical protein C8R45DRAFT_928967 [Mycena sanguinolenta]